MKRPDTPEGIIPEADVVRVHAYANFGATITKREILNEGVLQFAFGFSTGHTLRTILFEHGLLCSPRKHGDTPILSQKGFRYMRSLSGGTPMTAILDVMRRRGAPDARDKGEVPDALGQRR
jgi:hypothetical protein